MAVLLVCLAAAGVTTWPLPAHLATAVPLGTENELTVPVFSLWTLWWNSDRAAHGFQEYWNAPFFHPTPGAQGFSESLILIGLLVAPLWATPAAPALIYNLALLALLGLNGAFTYRLARAFGAAPLPATLGAASAVTLPFVAKHLGVLPLLPLFGIPWTLEGLVGFHRRGSLKDASWATAGFAALFLASQQLALLFLPFALAAALLALAGQRFRPWPLLRLLAVTGGVSILLLAIAAPGRAARERYGFERPEALVKTLSAVPLDYLFRPAGATVPIPPPASSAFGDPAGLFPGAVLLTLAVFGAWRGLRAGERRAWIALLLAIVVASFLLSLGLNLSLAGWRPFGSLRGWSPEMGQLRSPYRFAALLQIALPPLAAVGLDGLRHRGPPGREHWLIFVMGVLAAAENVTVPVSLQAIPSTPRTTWTEWLRAQPEGTVVAHVPFPGGFHVSDYAIEARRMFAQIDHRKPIVNGYSGFFSPYYTRLQTEMISEFPSRRLLCVLHCVFEANTLVVDMSWQSAHQRQFEGLAVMLAPLFEDQQVAIYHLIPVSCDCGSLATH